MKWMRRKKRAGLEPDRVWQMRRDAPDILWGSNLWRYMADLLCD
jgi:hypothetical protein